MKLSAEQLTTFLISISFMLFFAKLFGELCGKLKQPSIIGEILAGIILGPTVFGMLAPELSAKIFPQTPQITVAMDGITSLAVIMLLLVSGLEVDLSVVVRQSKTALFTSFMGMVFPFLVGFSLAYTFPDYFGINEENKKLVFALFMGTAMSISALPVIARTLMDLNIFRTEIGLVIIASAMFDDLTGWIVFSVILGMLGQGGHGFSFLEKLLFVFLFVGFMLLIARKIINKIFPYIQKTFSYPGGVLNFIFILGFLCAAFTEYIGIHAIFGAFIVGVTVGDTAHLREKTREIVHQFVTNIFAPLFFVSIGLRVNFITNFDPMLVLIVIALAFIGKVVGCGLGAYWGGMDKSNALAIGFGMNSRGAMEIILGLLALQFGLIQERVFVALVIMALFTSVASAPFMNSILKKRKKPTLRDLIDKDTIIFSKSEDRISVIKELVHIIAEKYRLNEQDIFNEVWKREEKLPSGIENYLAIPHAKAKVSKPVVGISVCKEGVNFESGDNTPSKFIFLLLSPEGQHETQLQILAEIAERFANRSKVENLLALDSSEKVASKLIEETNKEI